MNEFNDQLAGAEAKPRPNVRQANEQTLAALCETLEGYVPPDGEHTGAPPEEKMARRRQAMTSMNTQPTHPLHRPVPQPSATGGMICKTDQRPRPKTPLLGAPAVPKNRPEPTVKKNLPDLVFTTGRLRAGKDTFMQRFGYTIFAFADPLYELQKFFFGTKDKSKPGARKFLQQVGQWGRGIVSDEYPLSIQRAIFNRMINTIGSAGVLPQNFGIDWGSFGLDEQIWVKGLISRVTAASGKEARIGVSGCRFENEYSALKDAGFRHYHVMCSPVTWVKRLKQAGLEPSSPLLNDLSEKLAITLDTSTYATLQREPVGPKLAVIWSDDEVPPPSDRLYSLKEIQ